ncbi:MAG: DUF5794 domain-containing protein [Candidatus Nanosalina sp.]
MDLGSLTRGAQRHLDEKFDSGARKLVLILCLPLVDGVFATLLVSGAITTFSDIVSVSLTVFTGAGALAVLYSCSESAEGSRRMVRQAAPVLVIGAVAVSLVAPIYEELFYIDMMRTVAGLALLVISAKMFDVDLAENLSVPAVILTGFVLSVRNPGAFSVTLEYVLPAVSTALTASLALYAASFVDRDSLDLRYIRRGGALVLGLISLSLFGFETPSNLALGVFAVSLVYSYRPFRNSRPEFPLPSR